jgi:p-hydroxybenzoic acid efflux pump subunit AaeB
MTARTPLPFSLDPLRARRAAQSALASVLALVLVLVYRLPHGYWALVTIVVLTQPNVGASISKGALRLVGTLAGAAFGVVLLQLVQEPLPFLVLLSVGLVVTSYLGAGRVAPYAFAIFGITAIIVAMSGFLDPTLGVSIAVYRSAEVAIGIIVALLVTMVVWPIRATEELPRRLAATVRACAELFEVVTQALLDGRALDGGLRSLERDLSRSFTSHLALLEQAGTESRVYQRRRERAVRVILLLERTFTSVSNLRATCEEPTATHPQNDFRPELPVLVAQLATTFEAVERAILQHDRCPEPGPALDIANAALEARYGELRRTGGLHAYPITDVARLGSIILALHELSQELTGLSAAITQLNQEAESVAPVPSVASSTHKAQMWQRLPPLDPRRLRYGVKVALAVLIAFLGWLVLQWPFGASAVLTAYVVTQGSTGGSNRKALLRLIGAVVGGFGLAIPSIILVIPHIETLYSFSVLIFGVMFLCAYVMTGSERISYAGLQAAIAFCLTLVPDAHQDVSLNPAVTRAVAVLLGSLVGVLVVRCVWPVHASRELRETLAGVLRDCAAAFHALVQQAVDGGDTRSLVAQRRGAIKVALNTSLSLLSEATVEADDRGLRAGGGIRLIEATEVAALRLGAVQEVLDSEIDQHLRTQIGPDLRQLDDVLDSALAQLADDVETDEGSTDLRPLAAATNALDQRLLAIRAAHSTQPFPPAHSVALLALVERCKEFSEAVSQVGNALAPGRTGA